MLIHYIIHIIMHTPTASQWMLSKQLGNQPLLGDNSVNKCHPHVMATLCNRRAVFTAWPQWHKNKKQCFLCSPWQEVIIGKCYWTEFSCEEIAFLSGILRFSLQINPYLYGRIAMFEAWRQFRNPERRLRAFLLVVINILNEDWGRRLFRKVITM